MALFHVEANYYQQFDADYTRDIPAEGYGGWKQTDIALDSAHTAVVVMHAWDTGTGDQFPGWYRAVEYIPRANAILAAVFPPLLSAVREAGLHVYHVVGDGDYYQEYPGYRRARELAPPAPPDPGTAITDPTFDALNRFRADHVFVGAHNRSDVQRGFSRLNFPPQACPIAEEGIAENGRQLFGLCRDDGINHLIYIGFAINWCLLLSPGGMVEMSKHAIMCSTIRQAVTAVENKETARGEAGKENALWRVALAYGFVFDVAPFIDALQVLKG